MRAPVRREELDQIPHLNAQALGDRALNLMSLWDGEQWHLWLPVGDSIVKTQGMSSVVEGNYLAKAPENNADLFIPFLDLMWQRASWPEIVPLINAIEDDFRNMGTSIAKLKYIFHTQDQLPKNVPRTFAATEIEYLVILCRTVFDLLQEMIARTWHTRVQLQDPFAEKRRKAGKLPDTFSKMCLEEKNSFRASEEIEQKFGLPKTMADQYAQAALFFAQLRGLRDGIVHGGMPLDYLFETERGFCIRKDSPLLKMVPEQPNHAYNENLVSVLPWLSAVILRTIDTCNSMMNAFASCIVFPEEIAPGYRVFFRGLNNTALQEALSIHSGGSPWWVSPEGKV